MTTPATRPLTPREQAAAELFAGVIERIEREKAQQQREKAS